MALKWPDKDPQDVLDYKIDWSGFLVNDTIVSSTWDVPSALTVEQTMHDDTSTTLWLSGGGEVNVRHDIVNHVLTSAGREIDQTVQLKIKQR